MNFETLSLNYVTITGTKVFIFILALKKKLMTIINLIPVLIMLPLLIIYLFRRFFPRKNAPDELFAEALRNENSGYFETAITKYEKALDEVKKARFHGRSLKSKINEKLKVLHTVIEYKNGFHFVR